MYPPSNTEIIQVAQKANIMFYLFPPKYGSITKFNQKCHYRSNV